MSAPPLAGLRVLDLSRVLAGPWAAQILGDLGADVVKVERPGAGDDTRHWGPPFTADGTAAYYLAANRNKRGIAVDIARPEGQAIVRKLAAGSDIVIENFKVGDLARYGLDYAGLSAENPRLIYCSVTGFGQDGPNAHRPGYDFMIQGLAGFMSLTGAPGGEPYRAGVAVADLTTGMYAAMAILAALNHRHATGQGQHIDMALFDTAFGWLANQAQNYLVGGAVPERTGNAHLNVVPYQVFATATAPVIVAVGNDRQFAALARLLDRADWAADPRFATNPARLANRATLIPLIEAEMLTRPQPDWLAALEAAGIPCGPVNDLAAAFAEPQVAARGLIVDIAGTPTIAQPMRFSASPVVYNRPPPKLGEHTAEVLAQAGYSSNEIAELEQERIIARASPPLQGGDDSSPAGDERRGG